MMNFLFCTVLPMGAFKVDQTHKFDDFLDLTQLFQIGIGPAFVIPSYHLQFSNATLYLYS